MRMNKIALLFVLVLRKGEQGGEKKLSGEVIELLA